MAFKFKATSYQAQLKPGLYPASVVAIEEREGDHGEYLIWHFVVHDERGQEINVSTLSSAKFSPQAKARKFAEAILQRTIRNGEELEPAQLYSESCQILVTVEPLADGGSRNSIEQVLPARTEEQDDEDVPF
jgi:hypothetical protein